MSFDGGGTSLSCSLIWFEGGGKGVVVNCEMLGEKGSKKGGGEG